MPYACSLPSLPGYAKGGRERLVPVLPLAQSALSTYLEKCPQRLKPDGPLFVGVKGGRLNPRIVQLLIERLRTNLVRG